MGVAIGCGVGRNAVALGLSLTVCGASKLEPHIGVGRQLISEPHIHGLIDAVANHGLVGNGGVAQGGNFGYAKVRNEGASLQKSGFALIQGGDITLDQIEIDIVRAVLHALGNVFITILRPSLELVLVQEAPGLGLMLAIAIRPDAVRYAIGIGDFKPEIGVCGKLVGKLEEHGLVDPVCSRSHALGQNILVKRSAAGLNRDILLYAGKVDLIISLLLGRRSRLGRSSLGGNKLVRAAVLVFCLLASGIKVEIVVFLTTNFNGCAKSKVSSRGL